MHLLSYLGELAIIKKLVLLGAQFTSRNGLGLLPSDLALTTELRNYFNNISPLTQTKSSQVVRLTKTKSFDTNSPVSTINSAYLQSQLTSQSPTKLTLNPFIVADRAIVPPQIPSDILQNLNVFGTVDRKVVKEIIQRQLTKEQTTVTAWTKRRSMPETWDPPNVLEKANLVKTGTTPQNNSTWNDKRSLNALFEKDTERNTEGSSELDSNTRNPFLEYTNNLKNRNSALEYTSSSPISKSDPSFQRTPITKNTLQTPAHIKKTSNSNPSIRYTSPPIPSKRYINDIIYPEDNDFTPTLQSKNTLINTSTEQIFKKPSSLNKSSEDEKQEIKDSAIKLVDSPVVKNSRLTLNAVSMTSIIESREPSQSELAIPKVDVGSLQTESDEWFKDIFKEGGLNIGLPRLPSYTNLNRIQSELKLELPAKPIKTVQFEVFFLRDEFDCRMHGQENLKNVFISIKIFR